jgi:putative CocE/NonD family hydrolase
MTRSYAVSRRIFAAIFRLPPRTTRDIVGDVDFGIPMPDGIELLADRWAPADLQPDTPTILVRTCYARNASWAYAARAYAERGYQTVVVNSRGTFGSGGGEFYAMHHERDDGLAVIDWVREQPWYRGRLILAGASYLGYTQWAVAAEVPDDVIAMHPHVTSARLAQSFMMTGAIELDTAARWTQLTATQELPRVGARIALGIHERQLQAAMKTLPLSSVDARTIGRPSRFYQDTVSRTVDDPFWNPWDRRVDVPRVKIPASFLAGWYDPFLIDQLADYQSLRDAGTPARLSVGPWTHVSMAAATASMRDTLEWSGIHSASGRTLGRTPERAPVRVYVMGAHEWQDFDHWPPREAKPQRWFLGDAVLGNDGSLGDAPPASSAPSRYRYDPAHPTPSVGGRLLLAGAGRKNNKALEKRPDVVTFTSEPLVEELRIVGELSAEIWMSSTRPTWDLFVRLCEVDARGRSFNVSDGLIRVVAAAVAGPQLVRLQLSPTAQVFARGHRLRIQVSSGAHPRFARNLGSDESADAGTAMFAAEQTIYHDAEHPSVVVLPALP